MTAVPGRDPSKINRPPMRLKRLLLFAAFVLSVAGLSAQDVHYTLHNYSPLWLNPANTGNFAGSVRVGGIYRGQWYSISGIQTPSAYADAPLAFGLRKQDWIGVGLTLVNDKAGLSGTGANSGVDIVSNFFGLSAAYHLALDKKRRNVLTLGAQYGSISYGADFEGTLVQQLNIASGQGGGGQAGQSEFMQSGNSPGGGMNNNRQSVNDLNAGVRLKLTLDEKKDNVFEAGVSLLHLTSPDRRTLIMSGATDTMTMDTTGTTGGSRGREARERRRTLHAHARLDMEISEKWRFQPTLFYQQTTGTSSLTAQAWMQTQLKKDLGLRLGLGYRSGDAAQLLMGLNFKQVRAALSYDVTVSSANPVTNYQGAFELSAAYIFNIYKKPDVTPTILCPDL